MDFVKAQLARIQQQLSGLSASQKMLTACLVAIMVMTLFGWSHWAGEPDMVPILDQSLSSNEIGQISMTLDGMGVSHRVTDGKVYVPADRQVEVLATLGYSQALPSDFSDAFDTMIKGMSWLDPPSKTDRMFLQARTNMLTRVLRSFPGVATAAVTIDPTQETKLSGDSIQPTASVALTTSRNGKADPKKLTQSAIFVLSGAQAGLLPANIKVVIDGSPMKSGGSGSDSDMGDSFVDTARANEDLYCDRIQKVLDYIPKLKIAVYVKINTTSADTETHNVNPKQIVNVPISEKEQTTESHGGGDGSLEAGAASNVGVSVSNGSAGGGTSTTSDQQTEYKSDYYKQDQTVHQGPGDSTPESASISVPRTYLISEFKSRNNKREPEEAELQQFATARFADIRSSVKLCTGIATDDKVSVVDYSDDSELQASSGSDTESASVSPITIALTSHTKEIGVGLLAAVSLFMVSMIVRKGAPPVALADAGATADQLSMSTEALAMAKGDANAMDGVELDEAAVKAQQVVEQVQQMVQTNPDGAATLVKRWLNR